MNVALGNDKLAPDTRSRSGERGSDLERRRELGQFFTPKVVAGFMWNFLEIIHGTAFPRTTTWIDPACGEGVFLRVARECGHLSPENLFGTDIDEKLVAAWHADPLLRGTRLQLANGLMDQDAIPISEGSFDMVMGNPPFSGNGLKDLLRLLEYPQGADQHHEPDFFEASSLREETISAWQPVAHQQRVELDRLAKVLSQYACWKLNALPEEEADISAGSPSTDLFAGSVIFDRRRPTASDHERTAQLIGNWPAGRMLDYSRPEFRDVVQRLASTSIEVFFTERFLRLAKPGGFMAVIVPESIVASDRLGPLRRWLLGRMDLLASVGLPQKVFTGVGANARTTILFACRRFRERPADWLLQAPDGLPDAGEMVFLASPQPDAENWSLDAYLAGVLADAKSWRRHIRIDTK
jgi:hypothetical protein